MNGTYTTAQVALQLGWSYDYTRKLLRQFEPVATIGKNKLWTQEQIDQLRGSHGQA